MGKFWGGVVLSAFLAAPAMAADIPARMPVKAPPPVIAMYNWSGLYIGGHAGYGWGDSEFAFAGTALTSEHDVKGFVGGVHTGINWQFNRFVLGIEGAVSLDGIDGSGACPVAVVSCETDIDHFWRAGGRVGFAAGETGNWLFYGMGGFARAYVRSDILLAGVSVASDKTHHHGWYGGVGIEWGFAPNFALGAEAYYVGLGGESHFTPGGVIVPGFTRNVDLDFAVVQARATYKFNWLPFGR
jgi:outer membrane immunogenic protein